MGTLMENILERVKKGGKAVNGLLGVDVEDEKSFNDFAISKEERNILERAMKDCKEMEKESEWPVKRKAAKPTTESNTVTISRGKQKALDGRDANER